MTNLSNLSLTQSVQLGALVGALLSALLFFTVPAYHDFYVAQWSFLGQHWILLAPASVLLGFSIARLTD